MRLNEATILPEIIGRDQSLFGEDFQRHAQDIHNAVAGSRILVTGAAGSIGAAVVKLLLRFEPAAMDVIDPNENGLVELVRDIRSGSYRKVKSLSTYAIALGSLECDRLLRRSGAIDYVLNFAALKHVRAERDVFTMMRMLDTNVLALAAAMPLFAERAVRRVFSVSSDKAVRPASLMGASKTWMERVLVENQDGISVSAARFANVAFSDGSLPYGFLRRLEKRQPIAAPSDIRRYFISTQEAAELCLLAAFVGNDREVFVPALIQLERSLSLAEVAEVVLRGAGLESYPCASVDEAREMALLGNVPVGRWPCVFAPSSSSGEKPLEEFVAPWETADKTRFDSIEVISLPSQPTHRRATDACSDLLALRQRESWSSDEVIAVVKRVVPELAHVDRRMSLDQQM